MEGALSSKWDERFAVDEYVFGTEPNDFLVEQSSLLRSPVLSIGEGEGRNAVFLALLGLAVHAVDSSAVGLSKARALARSRGLDIHTIEADLADHVPPDSHYEAVISIFAHLPSPVRQQLYPRIARCLKPGGILLMEAYAEAQIHRDTGGPKSLDMLMSVGKVREEFPDFEPLILREIERDVCEGHGHTGAACVVQFVGRRMQAAGSLILKR